MRNLSNYESSALLFHTVTVSSVILFSLIKASDQELRHFCKVHPLIEEQLEVEIFLLNYFLKIFILLDKCTAVSYFLVFGKKLISRGFLFLSFLFSCNKSQQSHHQIPTSRGDRTRRKGGGGGPWGI